MLCLLRASLIGLSIVLLSTLLIWIAISPASAEPVNTGNPGDELITINQPQQGSLLFSTSHKHLYRNAPVLNTEVSMDITAMTARVKLSQTFRNEGQDWVEGIYVFPLPENAAVDHMRMRIGERIIEGQIKEREEAKIIYEKAKSSGRKAALIEQERPNLFTNSVANIGPGETIVITIEYQQTLDYRDETFSVRFPMTITPRYMPGQDLPLVEESLPQTSGMGWAINTTEVPDASRISPPVLNEGEKPVNPVTLNINLNAGITLDTIRSLYHEVDISRGHNGKAKIQLKSSFVPADRDFVLEWRPVASQAPRAALFNERKHDEASGEDVFYSMMMIMPPVGEKPVALPREIIFIIDTSGSMGGKSIREAKSALDMAIRRLKPTERFNIIEFNSTTKALFDQPVNANAYNINQALEHVGQIRAGGGTEMRPALNLALSYPVNTRYIQQVVFLTDGAVGNERALFEIIHDELDDVRLFTVGIGSAPNSFFMRKAAQFGRGTFTYIGDINEVGEKMNQLFTKLETPMMSNLTLHWPDNLSGVEYYPARLPDIYAGEPLVITARSSDLHGEITITGQRGQQPWQAIFPFNKRGKQPGIGVLWAREKIASLKDSLQDGADKAEVRQSVINTALAHHLVSKYTSLVAVDITPSRPVDEALKKTAVPTNLPHGMQRGKVFGAPMTQTATAAQMHMLIGLSILLLVGVSWYFSGWSSSLRHPRRIPS